MEISQVLQKEQLEKTVNKMIRIVRADTGASGLYRDMLLSLLPNSTYKVNISYWCYKADRDDFQTILNFMQLSHTDMIWIYEEILQPYREELKTFQPSE